MDKISIDNFQENKGLIIITILFAFLVAIGRSVEPQYLTGFGAIINVLISWPLVAWWFMAFWNRILTKFFQLKEISYGIAFVLIGAMELMF